MTTDINIEDESKLSKIGSLAVVITSAVAAHYVGALAGGLVGKAFTRISSNKVATEIVD